MAELAWTEELPVIIDQLAKWRAYTNLPRLRRAFELLDSPAAATWPDGRLLLDGELIIAMPQGYATRPLTEGKWEAHRRYIDIQYIVAGREKMGWVPLASLAPATTFDVEKDVGFYSGEGDLLTVRQGMFALFFPHDAHMPCLQVDGVAEQVRKIVMKVSVE